MNAKLQQQLKDWDRQARTQAVDTMVLAIESGDIPLATSLLNESPMLDYFVPYQAASWSQLSAAAGHWDMLNFWQSREKTTRSASQRATPAMLLFWAMGCQYIKPKGDPAAVAKKLLDAGASIEGEIKDHPPLHRAVVMNRPLLVELLIRRGANLNRPNPIGESPLQVARRNMISQDCSKLLEQAGAELHLPKKPTRPKPIRTIDLRDSATKLGDGLDKAVQKFARQHANEPVTAISLASIPHEAYVMISFDTEKFDVSPWDAKYSEFAWIKFPDWARAFEGDQMHIIDLKGRTQLKDYDEDEPLFQAFIVATLKSLQARDLFAPLNTAKGCRLGIEMTNSGNGKFWRL